MRLFLDSGNILSQVMRMKVQGKKYRRLSWGAFLLSTVASVMLVALPLILATSQVAALSDTTPPTVSITFPGNGAWVKGTTTVYVSATDSVGVSKVELYADGMLKGTDTTSPYNFVLDTKVYADGSTHTLSAIAYDTSNNKATLSKSITVDNTPPGVSIMSPTNRGTVTGVISVSVYASDANSGIYLVFIYVDGKWIATDLAAPYVVSLDTTTYASGSHSIQAIALDKAYNYSTIEISVTKASR